MAKAPSFTIPTGYEGEQRKIASRRKLAQLLQEQGLANSGPMQSWTQVLGKIGQSTAGAFMDKKADKREGKLYDRMLSDRKAKLAAFNTATSDPKTDPMTIHRQFSSDPTMADQVGMYTDAAAARLKDNQDLVLNGDQYMRKGNIAEGSFAGGKPTDGVLRMPNGDLTTNNVATVGALARQGAVGMDGAPVSMTAPDPTRMPPQGMAAPVQGAPPAGAGGVDLSLLQQLKPEEVQIMMNELKRRAGGNGHPSGQPYYPPNPNVPMGSPLSAQRAPAGAIDGKPYWLINGKAYDNPEGQ